MRLNSRRRQIPQLEEATFTGAVRGHSSGSSVAGAGNGQLILARSGYPRLILLSASRAEDLMTPEHCVLNLHKDRDVHAAQFQHHVTPRYWATECDGCTIFHPIGMYCPRPHLLHIHTQRIPNTLHGLDLA